MSYQVLSLKWRPQAFDDVIGQDHVTKTLINAFMKNRIAQGYTVSYTHLTLPTICSV